MAEETIDAKMESGQAHEITAVKPATDHPAILALTDVERTIWVLRQTGETLKSISETTGVRLDEVCRIVAAIRDRLNYLLNLRNLLIKEPTLIGRFLGGRHCGRCIETTKTDGGIKKP